MSIVDWTPSAIQRMGRVNFNPNADPMDFVPFNKNNKCYYILVAHYLEGWKEARKQYELERASKNICPCCGQEVE